MVPLFSSAFVLENREYDENSSLQEIQAIEDRVYVNDQGYIVFIEVPVISEFSAKVMLGKLLNLVLESENKAVFLDLELAKPPTFKIRKVIFEHLKLVVKNAELLAFSTGKNKLLNIAVEFVMKGAKFPMEKIFICTSKTDAIHKIDEYIRQR